MKPVVAVVLALILAANGLAMLGAGRWWYEVVPGVVCTGPFNPHFVKDIGAAYLTAAGALAWAGLRPVDRAGQGAVLGAAVFLGLHALVHVADEVSGPGGLGGFLRDVPGVFVPALLAIWIAAPARHTR